MTIKPLSGVGTEQLATVFNLAFSDYFIPLKLDAEQLQAKMIAESIDPDLSAGAFEDDQPVAFILHGNDGTTAYNAGTGVIPAFRGRRLTQKLYDFLLPKLAAQGFEKVILEVISQNRAAIRVYEKTGFNITRTLGCYRGSIDVAPGKVLWEIRGIDPGHRTLLASMRDWAPAWQNSDTAIKNMGNRVLTVGAYENGALLGYVTWNPQTGRIHQFAVAPAARKQKIASSLFAQLARQWDRDFTAINVDESSEATTAFLQQAGLSKFLEQFEMEYSIRGF